MKTNITTEQTKNLSSEALAADGRWLVIINHHEARVFRSVNPGTVSEQILSRAASEPSESIAHAKDFSRGGEKPDPNAFFPPVAKVLKGAVEILVFGSGTGRANEMNQFVSWLEVHQTDLAKRVIGAVTVDEHHLTDAELLAKARDFYALPRRSSMTPI
jgi:hypothetical protein